MNKNEAITKQPDTGGCKPIARLVVSDEFKLSLLKASPILVSYLKITQIPFIPSIITIDYMGHHDIILRLVSYDRQTNVEYVQNMMVILDSIKAIPF